ncbi:MAG: D-ribose ABC transporter substrate-binding protein [Thermoprotei archaeon]|nr:MAG: D-ribose ABC transporter substrate-binding protein [Thermoprotei archaeon]
MILVIIVVIAVVAAYYFFVAQQAGPGKISLALLISNLGNPYFVALRDGAQAAVNELKDKGVDIEMEVYDAKDDPSLQSSQIETAVGKKVSAILINPVHAEAIQPALRKAIEAGIPVITTDRDVADTSLRLVFIGTDNVAGAEAAAQALLQALEASGKPTPWKIVILNGIPGTTAAEDRKKGFHNILDPLVGQGKIEIVAEEVANFRRDEALSKMESILAAHTVDAVIAANDEMALGAIQAIEGAGLKPGDDIIVVGYDAIPDAVQAVKAEKMYATIAQSPFLQGYWAVYAAYYHIVNDWKPSEDWIPTPTVVVTKDNADTFQAEVSSPKPLPGAPTS